MTEKRRQILETATHLFGKHGFHAVGVDWIISKSTVSKMTMYRYFPSKSDLVLEVLRTEQAAWAKKLDDAIATTSDPVAQLEQLFECYRTWFDSPAFSGSLFAHAASEFADKGTQIHRVTVSQKADLTTMIEGIIAGIVPPQNVRSLAHAVVMLLDGATLAAQITGRSEAAADAWAASSQLLGIHALAEAM